MPESTSSSAGSDSDERTSRPAFDERALRADIAALEAHLRATGAYERPAGRVLRSWLVALVLAIGGLLAFMSTSLSVVVRIAGLLLSTAGCVAVGTIGHTASHGGFSKSRRANQLLYYASYPFMLMVSARYWRHSHVHVHHAAPNVVGVDYDCDLLPLFALNDEHGRNVPPAWRRVQGWVLPLVLPFNGFNIQRQGWKRLLEELRDPKKRKPEVWADLVAMLAHALVFIVVPMAFASPLAVLGTYALRVSLIGSVLFAVLAPGHYPAEAACLDRSQRQGGHFWLRQTVTTVNFRTGLIGRWLCSGLEYQLEHHLLPGLSHVHLPAVSPAVRAICLRHGLPHRTFGWGEAVLASWRVFFHPKPVAVDALALRGGVEVIRGTEA